MRKILSLILVGLLLITTSMPTFADSDSTVNFIPSPPTGPQKAMMEQKEAQYYAQQLQEKNASLRSPLEIYTLYSSRALTSYSPLKARHCITVAASSSQTNSQSFTLGFSVGELVKNYTLEASFTMSCDVSYQGPSPDEYVGTSSYKATHNVFSIVTWGTVKEYTYKVTNTMGQFLRYETIIGVGDAATYQYVQNANVAANVYYESGVSNSYRSTSTLSQLYANIGSDPSYVIFY